jgi:hypothetical protein
VASVVPSVDGSIDNLAVASYLVAWADRAYHVVDGHQAWASDRKACRRSDSSSMETWQRLPQYQDNIGRRKANDRYGSSYEVLNSLEDDSCSAEGELDVLDFKVRIHSSSAAVEG